MATIQVDSYPHIHSGKSTHKYMFDLPITTYPMAVVAIIFQFIFVTTVLGASFADGIIVSIKAALVIFTGVASCILAESLWLRYVNKAYHDFAGWFRSMSTTYPTITGMLFALSLPYGTPLYIVIIGGFVAIIIGKSIFGGVGQNIFNPALVGRAFITIAFASALGQAVKYTGISSDAIASASPLNIIAHHGGLLTFPQFQAVYGSVWKLFFGLYPSALGESLSFWIIGAFVYLSFKKTIDWFVPAIYVGLVFLMTWVIGYWHLADLSVAANDPFGLYFPLFHILTGGLLFGAVFMATEPVTGPVTRRGRALFAAFLAIITFAIRVLANAPEGVFYSILIMNMFTPLIDNFFMGQYKGFRIKELILWIVTALLIVGVTVYAAVTVSVGGVA